MSLREVPTKVGTTEAIRIYLVAQASVPLSLDKGKTHRARIAAMLVMTIFNNFSILVFPRKHGEDKIIKKEGMMASYNSQNRQVGQLDE